jgi:DNA-directed RNA polymerase specialized sigma24 family protein
LNDWLSNNYNELKNICSKFSTPEEVDDLLHLCIEQFINNKKVHQIPDKEKLYFFTKIVRNQYHSKSSKYHYTYRRYQFNEIIDNDIAEIEYQEDEFNMNWVHEQLKTIDWYYGRLFELYIEEGCSVTRLSKRTTIPINSVSRDINKVRRQLKQLRDGMRM